tara:strand:+ start:2000 stop:2173 length:174 start_codon:yes stop_codon:yes gene_type:complete
MSKKKFIYRKIKVFELEFEAWSRAHAEEMLEDGYLIYHDYEMECKEDKEVIVSKVIR